jgi:prophage antirepressor-like protein
MYSPIPSSRKPAAKRNKKCVTAGVLPTLRRLSQGKTHANYFPIAPLSKSSLSLESRRAIASVMVRSS